MAETTQEGIDLSTARKMIRYGGSFVEFLGRAALRADENNLMRLKNAFPEYFTKYAEFVEEDDDE